MLLQCIFGIPLVYTTTTQRTGSTKWTLLWCDVPTVIMLQVLIVKAQQLIFHHQVVAQLVDLVCGQAQLLLQGFCSSAELLVLGQQRLPNAGS